MSKADYTIIANQIKAAFETGKQFNIPWMKTADFREVLNLLKTI